MQQEETQSSSKQCDLNGDWDGYHNGTRSTGWRFEEIFTAGGSTMTYRAIHLSPQRAPTGSEGAITRSTSGNFLFHTLQTRIPQANGNYQASFMKVYDADASCDKLTERQNYNSTYGVASSPGSNWLQRVSIPQKPTSPVGKPTGQISTIPQRTAPKQLPVTKLPVTKLPVTKNRW